jgi:hypothetical protein
MDNLENAYNQAMERMQKGRSKQQALLEFDHLKTQLDPLLEISLNLSALPKNAVPQPAMQRKYALAPSKGFWLTWLHVSKFAGVSMSLMLLISAFTVTGYAAFKSAPGQALFQVKKSAEQLQVILASSQGQKAIIQVQLAESRLNDAREVFNNPNSTEPQKAAVLKELSDQTNSAVTQVSTVAKSDPSSNANNPLLSSLDNITQQQQKLLTKIQPDGQIKLAANDALATLNQTAAKISEIKSFVATAGSDQALAKLNGAPNSLEVSGQITKITDAEITVEKTVFAITPQTQIKDASGTVLSLKDLSVNEQVNVVGVKKQDSLLAQQIFITVPGSSDPEVKGISTDIKASGTVSTALKKLPDQVSPSNPALSAAGAPPQADPNATKGSFILEDPAQQFFGN